MRFQQANKFIGRDGGSAETSGLRFGEQRYCCTFLTKELELTPL